MEIIEIKQQLGIQSVLSHYGLRPDRNHRLRCPWHDDTSPSLQIYPKTNTWTCFSTNCNAGSGDQIDFIMRMEECSKHAAILKAKSLLGYTIINEVNAKSKTDYEKLFQQLRKNFKSGRAVKYIGTEIWTESKSKSATMHRHGAI